MPSGRNAGRSCSWIKGIISTPYGAAAWACVRQRCKHARPLPRRRQRTKSWRCAAVRGTSGPVRRSPRQYAWRKAEKAMDHWQEQERLWQTTKEAMPLFTPTGELNTRARAEAVLAETLPQLPDSDFAKTKRQLQKPEMLNYLDRVQQQIAALPLSEEVKQAAVRQEGLRRRPEALHGESQPAAARRGLLLLCAVVLSQAGAAGPTSRHGGPRHSASCVSGQQLGGMRQERAAHAASRPPPDDARAVGSQAAVLELPYVRAAVAAARPHPTSDWESSGRRA